MNSESSPASHRRPRARYRTCVLCGSSVSHAGGRRRGLTADHAVRNDASRERCPGSDLQFAEQEERDAAGPATAGNLIVVDFLGASDERKRRGGGRLSRAEARSFVIKAEVGS